jgi:hypothetical protein
MDIHAWEDTESTVVPPLVRPDRCAIFLSLPTNGICITLVKSILGSYAHVRRLIIVFMRLSLRRQTMVRCPP